MSGNYLKIVCEGNVSLDLDKNKFAHEFGNC